MQASPCPFRAKILTNDRKKTKKNDIKWCCRIPTNSVLDCQWVVNFQNLENGKPIDYPSFAKYLNWLPTR